MRLRRGPFTTLSIASLLLLPSLAFGQAKAPGFQLQVDGVLYSPSGTLESVGGTQLSTLLPSGPGFAVGGSLGFARRWLLAARVAYFGSNKDGSFRFVDELSSTGLPPADGSGPYALNRELHVTTIHGLVQYRHPLGAKMLWEIELGGGVSISRERLVLDSASGEKASAVGVQYDPSLATGAALGYPVVWNTDVVGGLRWSMSFTGDGSVWSEGDSPSFLNWTLGVRYPHETH